uniref:Uncharacterized protein n=1 Tax=Tetranychus urticae TaxID=32264 RepID=T1KGH4_TETUR
MRKFARFAGQDCTIILISYDDDYYNTLCYLKKIHNATIYIVNLEEDRMSRKLDQISDYRFLLDARTFKLMTPVAPMYFISIKNYPLNMDINIVMNDLYYQITESIRNSAILIGDSICIGFPTLCHAKMAKWKYNGWHFHGAFLETELLADSPLTEILKCIKPVQTESYSGVKRLTFIKMNNSNKADESEIIKFCIDCSTKSSSQCILSRKPFLWIVSSFKSDAQACLSKVQIKYPDAIIADPPVDLASSYHENQYTVESCEQKVSIEATSPVDNEGANGWNIFFRRIEASRTRPYASTKWSLLYDLFEKLYDYGAKKVIFDGNLYCAHFDSVSLYQEVLQKIDSLKLLPLKFVNEQDLNKQISEKLDRYKFSIPWCLSAELDIHCLVVKVGDQIHIEFMEIWKSFAEYGRCIFIKFVIDEFWIGFPDELSCNESEREVRKILDNIKLSKNVSKAKHFKERQSLKRSSGQISTARPSSELLESINLYDLVGNAYKFAFRSSQLQCFELITKPRIIERISLQRTEKQECNAALYYIAVYANFRDLMSWVKLSPEQIVKILVHFSQVIPLAVTAEDDAVYLVYNSWYEANSARNSINNLKPAKVPYFTEFDKINNFKQCFSYTSKYYVINDKGKVDEKIIKNKNQEDKIDSNSSTVQSKSDVDVSDEELMKKLEYFYKITTNPDVKFTRGMISIIGMHLKQNDCLAYIACEDKICSVFADHDNAYKAYKIIDSLKFKLLHANDEDDFDIGVDMQYVEVFPPKVVTLLANELRNPKKSSSDIYNIYSRHSAAPLESFYYGFRSQLERQSSNLVSLRHQLDT